MNVKPENGFTYEEYLDLIDLLVEAQQKAPGNADIETILSGTSALNSSWTDFETSSNDLSSSTSEYNEQLKYENLSIDEAVRFELDKNISKRNVLKSTNFYIG